MFVFKKASDALSSLVGLCVSSFCRFGSEASSGSPVDLRFDVAVSLCPSV